jgi:hypothetical protein
MSYNEHTIENTNQPVGTVGESQHKREEGGKRTKNKGEMRNEEEHNEFSHFISLEKPFLIKSTGFYTISFVSFPIIGHFLPHM